MAGFFFFLQALMSLKDKWLIKGRLLKHFGWAMPPAPSLPGEHSPSKTADVCIILVGFSPFYFSSSLSLSGIFQFSTQTCEIESVLLFASSIPGQRDFHQVQTGTNLEPLLPISAEKFPSCLGDLACCSLCLLLSRSPLFSACAPFCPDTCKTEKQKKNHQAVCAGRTGGSRGQKGAPEGSLTQDPVSASSDPLLPAMWPAPMLATAPSRSRGRRQQQPAAGAGTQVLQVWRLPGSGTAPVETGSRYLPVAWCSCST